MKLLVMVLANVMMFACPSQPPLDGLGRKLVITTKVLPNAPVGEQYTAQLNATGGRKPYSWKVASGALPGGLQMDVNGKITGIPYYEDCKIGVCPQKFTVTVTDSSGTQVQVGNQ